MTDSERNRASGLPERVENALVSLRVLRLSGPFCEALESVLRSLREALRDPENCRSMAARFPESPDAVDALNELARLTGRESFRRTLDQALLLALTADGAELSAKAFGREETDESFLLEHARRLAAMLAELIPDFIAFLRSGGVPIPRLRPSAARLACPDSIFLRLLTPAILHECAKLRAAADDPFCGGRVFRHDHGAFLPLKMEKARPVDAFYGYRAARHAFLEHFGAFAAGRSNLPLLISSLPGLGKTQMTISHSLHYPEITLILATPDDLSSGLENLIRTLEKFPARKFMLFFDDIDVPQMNWYDFRMQVGGAFSLPENISITIAANQQFPANISSRGRGFVFPIFDEIRCQEMVEDFLISCGVRTPTPELISIIAADYVEQFGQKMFEELSPRTLVRYLEVYRTDAAKRRRALDSSRNEVIPRPDPQVFYDENLKLMRAIYGDSVLDDLRRKELHET